MLCHVILLEDFVSTKECLVPLKQLRNLLLQTHKTSLLVKQFIPHRFITCYFVVVIQCVDL